MDPFGYPNGSRLEPFWYPIGSLLNGNAEAQKRGESREEGSENGAQTAMFIRHYRAYVRCL